MIDIYVVSLLFCNEAQGQGIASHTKLTCAFKEAWFSLCSVCELP